MATGSIFFKLDGANNQNKNGTLIGLVRADFFKKRNIIKKTFWQQTTESPPPLTCPRAVQADVQDEAIFPQ